MARTKSVSPDEKPTKSVPISSLQTLQVFSYEGGKYRKQRIQGGKITCLSTKGDALLSLDPDTLVTPK
jgi:hypothetical protein